MGEPKNCTVKFTTTKEMKMPVYVYYSLHNFYQNHRRYVKSRSDKQLRGETLTKSELSDWCDPLVSTDQDALLNPCGLIANSLFSDVIKAGSNFCGYTLNENDIAWKSDIENKFKNPKAMDSECQTACTKEACDTAKTAGTSGKDYDCGGKCVWENQCTNITSSDCTQYLWQKYPKIVPKTPYNPDFGCANTLYGVTQEHFIVWMRTAGLPNFRKLYGKIEKDDTSVIPAGTELSFDVEASFAVEAFKGKKYLVISTTSWFGGKNSFLGIAYIVVGALCLLLSGLFFLKHKMSPRKLGDTRYLVWKDRN